MAIFATSDSFFTVWSVEDNGKYSTVKLGTSRKNKQTGEWANSSWPFVRFVGAAHEGAKQLSERDRITNVRFCLDNEPYRDKNNQLVYPKQPHFVVFSFDSADIGRKPAGKAPVDEYEPDEDGLPF